MISVTVGKEYAVQMAESQKERKHELHKLIFFQIKKKKTERKTLSLLLWT